ncbi:MAG: glycosyltransferase family 9 protein [Planctomycetes bacterium]|nr:glycosyltransferase family 9 protein [Planctomycetota bacterium]
MRLVASNPDAMGDMILRQPLYAALAGAGHELLLIVRSNTIPVARLVAPAARLLEFPVDPYTMTAGKHVIRLEWLVRQVRAFQPDLLLLASYQWTVAEEQLAAALSDVPVAGMTGHLCPGTGPASGIRFTRQVEVSRELHELEKNRRLCEMLLDRPVGWERPRVTVTDEQRQRARSVLARYGLGPDGFWVAAVGESPRSRLSLLRSWGEQRWAEVLGHAVRAHGWRFALLGLPEEQEASRRIRAALGPAAASAVVVDEPGHDFDLLAGATALCRGYLGRDTGPMHLAAALDKPVIAVFGGGHWPRFTPVATSARVLTLGVPCQDCAWDCPFAESYCIKEVPVDAVTTAIDEIAASSAGGVRLEVLPSSAELVGRMVRELRALHVSESERLLLQLQEKEAALHRVAEIAEGYRRTVAERDQQLQEVDHQLQRLLRLTRYPRAIARAFRTVARILSPGGKRAS